MRLLTSRRVAATMVCAALALGTAGTAVAHAHDDPRETAADRAHAPVPQAAAMLQQVKDVDGVTGVLSSVTDMLGAVLGADSGRLAEADATKYAKEIAAAMEAARQSTAQSPMTPGSTGSTGSSTAPNDAGMEQALAALDTSVDALVQASTKGDAATVSPQVQATLKSVADLMTATAEAVNRPATSLPPTGAAESPARPQAPTVPQAPAVPQTPVTVPQMPASEL
ncbi:hypothetical protein ACLGI4_12640 [Streptomyces sp. HMX112]|uniref:hypothetical protein n=1 Tax=Streptomyces sp. HMX112 TaxID=3390850 RepID=UPI003A7FF415